MRRRVIGDPETPKTIQIDIHVDEGKADLYLHAVTSAIHELEKREPKPCPGCGDR